jgi:hypothetical protein
MQFPVTDAPAMARTIDRLELSSEEETELQHRLRAVMLPKRGQPASRDNSAACARLERERGGQATRRQHGLCEQVGQTLCRRLDRGPEG